MSKHQARRSRTFSDGTADVGAEFDDMDLTPPGATPPIPAAQLVPKVTFAARHDADAAASEALAANLKQHAADEASSADETSGMPKSVDLEESGIRALMGQYQLSIAALSAENIRLRHEAIRARQDAELVQAKAIVTQAQMACDTAKKAAESKLQIRLDAYHYDPEEACLRLNDR